MLELDKNNDFVKSVFAYIDGEAIENAVKIFRQLEIKHQILFIPVTEYNKEEFCDDAWIYQHLYPFLSDSKLIFTGELLNFVEILDVNFREFGVTWRHWGEILAKYLNQNKLEKPLVGRNKSPKWKYIDFYMDSYASQWIKDYNDWAKAISEIIAEKDKVFASEYKANEIRTLGK